MRNFFTDLKYMCSSANQTSRGFYIFVTVMMAVLILGGLTGLCVFGVGAAKGTINILVLVLSLVGIGASIGTAVFLATRK